MSQYRLHIDIPLGDDKEKSTDSAYLLTEELIAKHGRTIPMAFKKEGDTMSQYRLHIDIPLGQDEDTAIEDAKFFVETLTMAQNEMNIQFLSQNFQMNYRLGHDDDRQKSNYLMKNEEGHVNNKKCRLTFSTKTV